jgi:HEAT repeat protein/cyclophilin family peptidyl-prolyl cis-trans isomerase
MRPTVARLAACVTLACMVQAGAASEPRRPLTEADITAISQLVMLEETRRFDEEILARLIKASHPEVRRRAVQSIGRIVDPRGHALLVSAHNEADASVAATVAWATGQLKDADAVAWLGGLLSRNQTSSIVAKEAACALGKIRTPEARTALASYLTNAPDTAASAPVVGEALLAIGRFTTKDDIAPIVRWATAKNDEVRWRAAWALFRPKDPAAIPHLVKLANDPSPEVRFWSVRGLVPSVVDAAGLDRGPIAAKLRDATKDPDRRVRTEAMRALVQYDDDASFEVVLAGLDSPDTWISVSVAEAIGRFQARAEKIVPKLIAASAASRPTALRVTALTPLAALAPDAARDAATALSSDPGVVARTTATQMLGRLGRAGNAGAANAGGGGRGNRPVPPARTEAEYRQIVERWIAPDYTGAAAPHVVFDTPKGSIEIELYPGDAPLATEYLVKVVESGAIVGTEFGRVVPNFVAQQRTITNADPPLRDEVNRHGLTRGNLSWASSGLDTGRPGYTLGSTPQPHNEGDFTALGRVVSGIEVVDRLELGDAITGARIKR